MLSVLRKLDFSLQSHVGKCDDTLGLPVTKTTETFCIELQVAEKLYKNLNKIMFSGFPLKGSLIKCAQ